MGGGGSRALNFFVQIQFNNYMTYFTILSILFFSELLAAFPQDEKLSKMWDMNKLQSNDCDKSNESDILYYLVIHSWVLLNENKLASFNVDQLTSADT